ncbi:MAG: PAS domain-containing protein [Archangiaceae bacterium]|nr:PAS domain-containing protein [Archangiaceae bacterium]
MSGGQGPLARLEEAIELASRGTFGDALAIFAEHGQAGTQLGPLAAALERLVTRFAEVLAAKEQTLGSLQLAMLDLEIAQSSLAAATTKLESTVAQYRTLLETTRSIPWQWQRHEKRFTYVGPQGAALLGCTIEDWLQPGFWEVRLHPDDRTKVEQQAARGADGDFEFRLRKNDGSYVTVRSTVSSHSGDESQHGFMFDITEQRRLELELQQAQKLESVGRLASGIAHEINTPVQFVSDSVHFVRDAFSDTLELLVAYRPCAPPPRSGRCLPRSSCRSIASRRKLMPTTSSRTCRRRSTGRSTACSAWRRWSAR